MAKLKHLAIACDDPEQTVRFYREVFDFEVLQTVEEPGLHGYVISDGTLSVSILRFRGEPQTGTPRVDHIGFEVEDPDEVGRKIIAAGGAVRPDLGKIKFASPDGFVFDLAWVGAWNTEPAGT
jgi:catechol 2,3-dioxygenase-like lactoylglutathione lyase family enzyme